MFDPVNKYKFYSLLTRANPMAITLANSSTSAGTQLQQWPLSANLASSQFSVLLSGLNWKIVAKNDSTKCLDAGAGTNGTVVTLQTCNGSAQQQWAFHTDGGYGSAYVQNVGSGRCLNATGKTQGLVMDVERLREGQLARVLDPRRDLKRAVTGRSTPRGIPGSGDTAPWADNPVVIAPGSQIVTHSGRPPASATQRTPRDHRIPGC